MASSRARVLPSPSPLLAASAGVSEAGGLLLGFVDGLEIDDDRVVTVAHDDPLRGLGGRIDLLVRNEGRYIDEVPGPGVRLVFQAVTPTHPDTATDHIDDGLLLAVMVGSGRRMRSYVCYPRPYPLRADGVPRYGRHSVHPGRLWRIRVEMLRVDDTHGVDPRCRPLFRMSSRVRAHRSSSFEGPRTGLARTERVGWNVFARISKPTLDL